jgi:hypothetical protein
MIPNKTKVLNLKTRKTQVPMGYLSLIFLIEKRKAINIYEKKKKNSPRMFYFVML